MWPRSLGAVIALAMTCMAWVPVGAQGQDEMVYVANADSGPVTAYAALSSGAALPSATLSNPNLNDTVWDPWGVTVDGTGSIYVQTFLSNATSFVFPAGADADTPPSRVFRAAGPDTRAIAVDADGYAYIATGEHSAEIFVLPPGAAGQPGNLYSVSPVRSIQTDEALWYPWADILTTDSDGNVLAAVVRTDGNAIEIFAGGASGPGTPNRVITGSHTGLGSAPNDHLAIVFSPFTGRIYAAVSAGAQTHISVFAGDAAGDARPIRTIVGSQTGLEGKVITGIADSQITGDIYAMVKDAQFGGAGQINVYGRLDNGDVSPRRSFTDPASQFAAAAGIAIAR